MLSLLMNFVLMGLVVVASIKAYYDIPFLNENPKTSASVVLVVLFLLIWTFPKILGFLIKLAIFYSILFVTCHFMKWDLSFLKGNITDTAKISETIGENVTETLNKVQLAVQPNQAFTVTAPPAMSGSRLNIGGEAVQLYGIDAPDPGQSCRARFGSKYKCGELSREALHEIVGKNELSCESRGINRRGQKVATCIVNGEDVAELMVRSGWAVADRVSSNDYVSVEKEAHDKKVGLWAGKFEAPWTWRSKHRKSDKAKNSDSKDDTPFQKLMDFFKK